MPEDLPIDKPSDLGMQMPPEVFARFLSACAAEADDPEAPGYFDPDANTNDPLPW